MTVSEAVKESGTASLFSGKMIKNAESKLMENEAVKYAMITMVMSDATSDKLVPKDTIKNKITGVLVITERRVFFTGGFTFKEIKIDDIKSMDSAKTPLIANGQIRIQSSTDMIIFDVRSKKLEEVERILTDLRNKRASDSSTSAEINNPDNYDQLRKLKTLLDEGIISNEDFEQKKKMLLGL